MPSGLLKLERREQFNLSADRVWTILSDTDHLNRFLKFPRVSYETPKSTDSPVFRIAKASFFGGLQVRWIEHPFEWQRGERYSVVREYKNGPVRRLSLAMDTEARGDATEVVTSAELELRWKWMRLPFSWWLRRVLGKMLAYVRQTIATHGQEFSAVTPPLPLGRIANSKQICRAVENIAKEFEERFEVRLSWLPKLNFLLCEGTDRQVLNLRPFEIARAWNVDRQQVLEFFLHATESGVFELDWQLQCPNCQVAKEKNKSLQSVTKNFHCDLCGIDIETDLAASVELRFRIHPRLRMASEDSFCLMGPYQSRHIFAQINLLPGDRRTLSSKAIGKRCRILGEQKQSRVNAVTVTEGQGVTWRSQWEVSSETQTTTITNESKQPITLVLENVEQDPCMVTAAYVTSLQTFRNLFGAEVLAAGTSVAVRHLNFLFSDLKDSTALYKAVGDAPAFGRVQKHFQYLQTLLEKHEGALVKTMGDAIMAVFSDPQQAMRCALLMQEEIGAFNQTHQLVPPVVLKLGLHCGPSIAINNDGILDYFGSTVNYAARIQGQSLGGDIVLSEAFLHAIEGQLAEPLTRWQGVRFMTELKGIGKSEPCLRLVSGLPLLKTA